jgi:colanic acid biosynthesis glycosyl transferase WcaI
MVIRRPESSRHTPSAVRQEESSRHTPCVVRQDTQSATDLGGGSFPGGSLKRRWLPQGIPLDKRVGQSVNTAGPAGGQVAIDQAHAPLLPKPFLAGAKASAQLPPTAKRILFVNQYYWPDHASTAQHLTDLAEFLAAQGFECHVLTSQGRYKPGEPKPPSNEIHQGVHIHRVHATSLGRRGTWSRMTDYLSFYSGALGKALRLPRFDMVVTLTTPPIIGLVGAILKRLRGSRHIYWSMDLHPDASMALGRMSPRSRFGSLMHALSDSVYRQSDRVVVLGPYMADRLALKQVAAERIVTIPVWSRRDEIYPLPHERNPLRKSLGLEGSFVAMYSGNLGLAHSFDEFLEAARALRERRDIVFLFVGDGPRKAEVQAARDSEGLSNIRLLDPLPRQVLHASLSMADVHLISMRAEMNGIVVPGKLYGAMAAGRPVVFVGPDHCESADTIKSAGCGLTFPTGDSNALVTALELLASDPSLCRQMGERARSAFLAHYERKLCCTQWHELIEETLGHAVQGTRQFTGSTREHEPARTA